MIAHRLTPALIFRGGPPGHPRDARVTPLGASGKTSLFFKPPKRHFSLTPAPLEGVSRRVVA